MSSSMNLYDITIPLFTKRLTQLLHCLKKAEQWADTNAPASTLVEARLYDDMQPLPFQIQTCYRMTVFLLSELKIVEVPTNIPENGKSFEEMYAQIEQMLEMLGKAEREAFEGKAEEVIRLNPSGGPNPWVLTGLRFVQDFLLPNYFFHATTAYDILRMKGVPLGKADFTGAVGA